MASSPVMFMCFRTPSDICMIKVSCIQLCIYSYCHHTKLPVSTFHYTSFLLPQSLLNTYHPIHAQTIYFQDQPLSHLNVIQYAYIIIWWWLELKYFLFQELKAKKTIQNDQNEVVTDLCICLCVKCRWKENERKTSFSWGGRKYNTDHWNWTSVYLTSMHIV